MKKLFTFSIILSTALAVTGCSSDKTASVQANKTNQTSAQKEATSEPSTEVPSFDDNSLLDVKKLAESGKGFNSGEFGIGSSIEDVQKKWGKPSAGPNSSSKEATYTYNNKSTEFKVTGGRITTISYYGSDLIQFTSKDILSKLGEPTNSQESEAKTILTYETSGGYKAIFICQNNGSDEYKLQAIDVVK
ncbi:DUF4309 domain-containing protein [Thermoactinomyces sp. DSM 45892]|uniref:DUF4309 domain-containing protein n=1 Tax=Thermoactinomyces sp. DSM 45892 TaxID=1882753 RepID=UPI000894BD07|nr:DUF4309 domain-containing protein [Thermoactinomyces sp. DSM 45892]SDZ16554.1 protein of unknown function [Thermoactinomyces sp. DSM 45892]